MGKPGGRRALRQTEKRIWAILNAAAEEHRRFEEEHRRSREAHRRFEEEHRRFQEAMRAAQARQDQMDEQLRRTERMFVSNWGKLVESLVEGDLVRLLRERNMDVTRVAQRISLRDDPRQREIDLIAWNGTDAVAVEVKTTLKVGDVRRFVELLDEPVNLGSLFRGLRLYGAVAYLRADEGSVTYAERRGLFVIRATGKSASIVNADHFRPRDFSAPPAPASRE